MLHRRKLERRRFVALMLAFLSALLLATVSDALGPTVGPVSANGATRVIVDDERAGPYLLRVGILPGSPKVGVLHVSILVQDAAGKATVSDATVMMAATGPEDSSSRAPVRALNQPQSPQLYEGNINLDVPGIWTLKLNTDSNLGKGSLLVHLEVTESTGFNSLFIAVGVVVVLIVGSLIWSEAQRNRRRSR